MRLPWPSRLGDCLGQHQVVLGREDWAQPLAKAVVIVLEGLLRDAFLIVGGHEEVLDRATAEKVAQPLVPEDANVVAQLRVVRCDRVAQG